MLHLAGRVRSGGLGTIGGRRPRRGGRSAGSNAMSGRTFPWTSNVACERSWHERPALVNDLMKARRSCHEPCWLTSPPVASRRVPLSSAARSAARWSLRLGVHQPPPLLMSGMPFISLILSRSWAARSNSRFCGRRSISSSSSLTISVWSKLLVVGVDRFLHRPPRLHLRLRCSLRIAFLIVCGVMPCSALYFDLNRAAARRSRPSPFCIAGVIVSA